MNHPSIMVSSIFIWNFKPVNDDRLSTNNGTQLLNYYITSFVTYSIIFYGLSISLSIIISTSFGTSEFALTHWFVLDLIPEKISKVRFLAKFLTGPKNELLIFSPGHYSKNFSLNSKKISF